MSKLVVIECQGVEVLSGEKKGGQLVALFDLSSSKSYFLTAKPSRIAIKSALLGSSIPSAPTRTTILFVGS